MSGWSPPADEMLKLAVWSLLCIALLIHTELCAAQYSVEQQCHGSLPDKRFKLLTDDTVVDQQSHLVWMRCSIGQHWDDKKQTCRGEAEAFTWLQANNYQNEQSGGDNRWRLPSIKELSSITDLSCYNPAINLQLFPNTPASHYWSATPFSNRTGHFWLVQFLNGENHTDTGKRLAYVRLVKALLPASSNR